MPGTNAEKRYHADARTAAKLAAQGWTHRNIAETLGREPEQVKALVILGERLAMTTPPDTGERG